MQWIRAHRYAVALIALAIFVVIGGITAKMGLVGNIGRARDVKNVPVDYPYYAMPITETGGWQMSRSKSAEWRNRREQLTSSRILFSSGGPPPAVRPTALTY